MKLLKRIWCFFAGKGIHKWKRVGGFYKCIRCGEIWPQKKHKEKRIKNMEKRFKKHGESSFNKKK